MLAYNREDGKEKVICATGMCMSRQAMYKAHHRSLCLLPSELARCSPAFASRAATQHECFEVCKGLSTHDKGVLCCACMGHSNDRKSSY